MNCLVVSAHPLEDSLCAHLSAAACDTLAHAGHTIVMENLYQNRFEPALTATERTTYYNGPYDSRAVKEETERLLAADSLILVFPTWWFGFPAILKGWFDRVWAPGLAYDHAPDLGPIRPRLGHLKHVLAVTTLGAPWWVDCLVMQQQVRKTLKIALLKTCAPQCRFKMLSLYKSEACPAKKIDRFTRQISGILEKW